MADATQQQRLVIPVGTQSDVEDESASLEEVLLAIDSSGEVIGYSTDGGTTWVWPSGGSSGRWEVVMTGSGVSLEPVTNEAEDDWLYELVTP